MQRSEAVAAARNDDAASSDAIADFIHDLNNRLLAIRGHAMLALIALDEDDAAIDDDAAAELHSLLGVVDEATASSRSFRRALITPTP